MQKKSNTAFECVDPMMGDEIWQLDSPALGADLRRRLEAHVSVCLACRMDRELDSRARRLMRAGELESDETSAPAPYRLPLARVAGIAAVLAFFGFLVGAMLLPPRPLGADVAARGESVARFTRPVEGEVVSAADCRLSWTEVPDATSYRVQVTSRDGDYAWSGTTTDSHLELPDDIVLSGDAGYKALLSTQPADLVPPGRVSVAFTAGSQVDAVVHRLLRAKIWLQALGLSGLAFVGLALVLRRG